MSEYQWVEFRAVDAPLDDTALDFMHEQSTRAEIDRWRFTNEYHFGNFRGNVLEMMRRGFDVHVHYTNFGLRRVCLRIPDGLDHAERFMPYLIEYEIGWAPDDNGTGGILSLEPEGDAGTWDWMDDVENLASDLIPLREMIIAGDFRPLYIAHVAFNYDDDALEPPIPPGLRDQHHAIDRLCEFYEIDLDLISVAAEASPEFSQFDCDDAVIRNWLDRQTRSQLSINLENCLKHPHEFPNQLLRSLRAESTSFAAELSGKRTIGELRQRAAEIQAERERKRQAAAAEEVERRKAAAERVMQAKLAAIAGNPEKSIQRIDAAINERNRPAYQRATEELLLLAQACGKPMATAKAEAIRDKYPTRSALSSELRKAGF